MTLQSGDKLRQERQARELTLEKISQETHIRISYLQALEAGDLDSLPSLAQARGFIRAYAGVLGLDSEDLLREIEDFALAPAEDPLPDSAAASPAGPDDRDVEAIFSEIGQTLTQQRELLGFSLQDVAQHTHLRVHYLEAMEAGKMAQMPSPVQGRGMLSNYATFLGMDPDPLLLRFADGLQADLASKKPAATRPRPASRLAAPTGIRRLISGDLLIGGVLVIAFIVFVFWGVIRIAATSAQATPEPTAPSIARVLLASPSPTMSPPTATPTLTSGEDTSLEATQAESIPLLPPEGGDGAVQIYIVVRQRAWMRVLVDGDEAFSGRVVPGSAYQFDGDSQVEILTGNGAGLQVFFNQQDLGPLGFYAEVINQVFTADGILTPTPTLTPTLTGTPRTTPTQTPSPTLSPTP
jgi:cytoskeletal protein RodZ